MSLSNYDIVYACSELFSIYIIYYFFQSLFGTQIRNKVITISVYALYFVLTIGIHFVANIPFLNLIFTIISLFSISLCYNTTFPKRLLAILEYIVLGFAVELIVSVVTKNAYIEPLQRYEYENEIGIFLSRMVIFWIVLLLGYFSHHRNEQKILPIWTMFVSPCIPILTIGVELLFTTVSGVTAQSVTVSMILLFIINIVVFFLYESLSIACARAAKATAAEQEKNYYQNQCQLMQNAVEDTRRFHHDISNHFSIVEAFLEGHKTNEASQYLQELIQKEEKKSVLYSTSGNIVVDSIINYKLRSVSDWNVAVTVDIVIPTELPIEIVDLSTILTNLLDNAVQALQKTDGKRELKIAMTYRKGMLFIAVKNTYPGKVHYENGEIVTTKEDTESHGYGLKNVESAAEKYDGICQLHHNDVYFDAEVALYL